MKPQPIETAEKDLDTVILVYPGYAGNWAPAIWDGHIWKRVGAHYKFSENNPPTHWMPQPPPPDA